MYSNLKNGSFPYLELPSVKHDKNLDVKTSFAESVSKQSIELFREEAAKCGYKSFGAFDLDGNKVISKNEFITAMNTLSSEKVCKGEEILSTTDLTTVSRRENPDGSYVDIFRHKSGTIKFKTYSQQGKLLDSDFYAHNGSRIIRRYDKFGLAEKVSIGLDDGKSFVYIDKVSQSKIAKK